MTGLDKIVQEIRDEAAAEAKQVVEAAKAKAEQVLTAARQESEAKAAKLKAAADQEVAEVERGRQSAAALQRRQRLLATKQSLLKETLNAALESLYALPDAKYFDLLVKLTAKAAEPGQGEMFLNEKDKGRQPADFADKVKAALPAGSSLTLSGDTRPIDGGFVLKYGDIEENCSFKAMFDARADEFSDLVQDTLFPAE